MNTFGGKIDMPVCNTIECRQHTYNINQIPWGVLQHIFHYVPIKYPILSVCRRWYKYARPLVYTDAYKTHVICRWMINNNKEQYICYLLTNSNIEVIYTVVLHIRIMNWNWCLRSNNMDVVQLGIKNGASFWSFCLESTNMEVVQMGIEKSNNLDWDLCLRSDNMKVVQMGIKNGAKCWNWCLRSGNMDVVQMGIDNGAYNWNWCLLSSNMDVVQLGINNDANNWECCLSSKNLDVVLFGISKLKNK